MTSVIQFDPDNPLVDQSIEFHFMYLIYHLRPQVKSIVKYIREDEIIDNDKVDRILSQVADTMKVRHLLDRLKEVENKSLAHDILYAATLYTKTWAASDVLEPRKRPHKDLDEEEAEPLPDEWPTDPHFEALKNGNLKVKTVAALEKKIKTLERMKDYFQNPKKYNVYEMNKEVKGRVLIINNEHFDSKTLGDRTGSNWDGVGLKIVLETLGFQVKIENDQTAAEMYALLEQECRINHTNYNCFILVILSHGHRGIVFGKDGHHDKKGNTNYLKINSFIERFSKVPSLAKKPKLFIIQACRGDDTVRDVKGMMEEEDVEGDGEGEVDLAHDGTEDAPDPSSSEAVPMAAADSDEDINESPEEVADGIEDHDQDDGTDSDEMEADGVSSGDANDHTDPTELFGSRVFDNTEEVVDEENLHILLAQPTTEGNVAWRNKVKGSWFIQAFIYVLANYAYKEDLLTLMLKVNELVRRAKGEGKESQVKSGKKPAPKQKGAVSRPTQVPEIQSKLIKKVYFFPGMKS